MRTVWERAARTVTIDCEGPFVIIGERINPRGRRRLAKSLAQGDMSLVREEALAQVEAGAHIIDVNVSAVDIDEERGLPLAVQTVTETVEVPISIDTANYKALRAALAVCPGKPLVNPVTGEETSPKTVLPLVKEYGCAVIGLCMDEEGIPKEAKSRLEIARRIVDTAQAYDIPPDYVIVDPLALSGGELITIMGARYQSVASRGANGSKRTKERFQGESPPLGLFPSRRGQRYYRL